MIDLSHLTEEEQEMIMMVLKRDAELKKAEEARISKLQNVKRRGSCSDNSLKYLTGEWFYEVKSRRHTDKIHGSEIILASIKQRKSSLLDGSLRLERSKALSRRGSEIVAPPKPARHLETTKPKEMMSILNLEDEKVNLPERSPGRVGTQPRHNPFNSASHVLVEPSDKPEDPLSSVDRELLKSSATEFKYPVNDHASGQISRTPGGSVTSEGSSAGFRPVPKKRTFLSRRYSNQPENESPALDPQARSNVTVPALRVSLHYGSSGSSNHSSLKDMGEQSQKNTNAISNPAPPSPLLLSPQNYISPQQQQQLWDMPKVPPIIGLDRDINLPSMTRERLVDNPLVKTSSVPAQTDKLLIFRTATQMKTDTPTYNAIQQKSSERDDLTQREYKELYSTTPSTTRIQDLDWKTNQTDSVIRQKALSLTQDKVEQPIRYNLIVIDSAEQHTPKKSNQKLASKKSPTTPNGDEEDSITKVLEWFSRSTDSNEWLDTEENLQAIITTDRHGDTKIVNLSTKDNDNILENRTRDRKWEAPEKTDHFHREVSEGKNDMKQIKLKATNKTEKKEVIEMQELRKGTRSPARAQRMKQNEDESQLAKISQLKLFWEKGNTGPKILINRSNTFNDKEQKLAHLSKEKQREDDVYTLYEREQNRHLSGVQQREIKTESVTYKQQADYQAKRDAPRVFLSDPLTLSTYMGKQQSPGPQKKANPNINTHHLTLPANSQAVDRRHSDAEIISLTRFGPQPRTNLQSRLSQESDRFAILRLSPPSDGPSQCTVHTPDPEKVYQSGYNTYTDQRAGNEMQLTPSMQTQKSSSENVKWKETEDRSLHKTNAPHSQKQASQGQESTAERIKQLKAFWEQERNKPMFYSSKSKGIGDSRVTHGSNLAKLNKRFTKSEYDLRSIVDDSGGDIDDSDGNQDVALSQRSDKCSSSLAANRAQFNNLCEFWGESPTNCRASISSDKSKSPKKKEPIDAKPPVLELKQGADCELYHKPTITYVEKSPSRLPATKSSPPSQSQLKSSGVGTDNKANLCPNVTIDSAQQRDSRKSSKDSPREERSPKWQGSIGKETRSPKTKKDGSGKFSSRGNNLRRATSMFALNDAKGQDQPFLGSPRKSLEASPIKSQSRRQSTDKSQNRKQWADKGGSSRRSSEDSETLIPRARAFVPRDYRHYLGMTEKTSVHTSLAPALKEQGSEGRSGYDGDLSGPVRASTSVGSEEHYSRRCSKTASPQRLWVNYSSSDTGRESSVSSTSETWSPSRNGSNREHDEEDQSPVRKALRRAEARPKNLTKSLEDITGSLTPRQDPMTDLKRGGNVSTMPSQTSSSFSDPAHLKKMSKSVPSFLQKEMADRDPDPTAKDTNVGGRRKAGRSLTNLTNSSGMSSLSSLSGSVMTMYTADFVNVEVQGNIQFSINYVQKLREFHIFVAQCRDLAAVDPKRGRSDPYVKSYLVPDKANLGKRKTSVKKKTQNPTFNEILRYRVRMEYLRTQTLILSVWHHDTFGKNSFLGEVDVDLSKWDFDHTQMNYLALKPRTTPGVVPSDDRGEMRLAIRFLPQIIHSEGVAKEGQGTGEIHIWVKECKNLPLIRATIDPYVKCFVLPDTSKKSRQKTRVLRRTMDPVFNHTMVYDGIRQQDLTEVCVELTVWDRDRLASNLLGGLRLGPGTGRSYGAVVDWMDSTSYEVALWERLIASPNEWVEEVLPLRIMTLAKTALK